MEKRRKNQRRAAILLTIFVSIVCCCACAAVRPESAPTPAVLTELDLRAEASPDLAALSEKTQLAALDVRGHEISAEEYDALHAALPKCRILWSVPISGERFDSNSTELTLAYLTQAEAENLRYFPVLTSVTVTGGDGRDMGNIAAASPDIAFRWTVAVYGEQMDSQTAALDLRNVALGASEELAAVLSALPQLGEVNLNGCTFTNAEKAALRQSFPKIRFLWTVDVGGSALDCRETVLNFNEANFSTVEEVIDAVRCFDAPERIDMAYAGFGDEEMERLSALFPEVKFVWMIAVGRISLRTDVVVFSASNTRALTQRLTDAETRALRYCTDLEALELNGQRLTDVSWISNLKKLKLLALGNNRISDISALEELDELIFVELNDNRIEDVSPLSGKERLLDVNLCFNSLADVAPLLTDTSLQRCWISGNGLSETQQESLTGGLPDCKFSFTARGAAYDGWRTHERYAAFSHTLKTGVLDPLFK